MLGASGGYCPLEGPPMTHPFRPFSIARQMVSVIDTLSALALRRIASRSALGGRNAMRGVTPVAGLPLFFCKTVIDLAI
jgi:hypothetical protein